MENKDSRVIFHIDVNSAYLSWEAADRMQHGEAIDLREIPSAVGGDPLSRHGIILAKSMLTKEYKVKTGESIFTAKQKCPNLVIVPPHYDLYIRCSNAMVQVLKEYTPSIQRFSVDECFLDFTSMEHLYPDYLELAHRIKDRIKSELGFTVNIGISNNKLLAKVASDLKKPDRVHTLFPNEIKEKMWGLEVGDLFMVGRATVPKLNKLNIFTIGDLAKYDPDIIRERLKSHGVMIWNYANGRESSEVKSSNHIDMKGIGNSTTMAFDVEDRDTAHKVLLSLCETVGMRLRNSQNCCRLVSVSIRTSDFISFSKQKKLDYYTDCTSNINKSVCDLFDSTWKGEVIRHLGVSVADLCTNEFCQVTLFEDVNLEKNKSLDKTVDMIRMKYGSTAIIKATFLHSGLKPLTGGIGEDSYPIMSSIL
jgi:DNA polymerase-4